MKKINALTWERKTREQMANWLYTCSPFMGLAQVALHDVFFDPTIEDTDDWFRDVCSRTDALITMRADEAGVEAVLTLKNEERQWIGFEDPTGRYMITRFSRDDYQVFVGDTCFRIRADYDVNYDGYVINATVTVGHPKFDQIRHAVAQWLSFRFYEPCASLANMNTGISVSNPNRFRCNIRMIPDPVPSLEEAIEWIVKISEVLNS